MNIEDLKEKYLKLTKDCTEIDYTDKKSVRKNNSAVNEMYKIVELIAENNERSEIEKFSELLNVTKNRTDIWTATHILEKLIIDKETERKALKIIKKLSKGKGAEAMGYQSWLDNYKRNKI